MSDGWLSECVCELVREQLCKHLFNVEYNVSSGLFVSNRDCWMAVESRVKSNSSCCGLSVKQSRLHEDNWRCCRSTGGSHTALKCIHTGISDEELLYTLKLL